MDAFMVNYKTIHVEYFSDKSEAIAARIKANKELGFDPMHGRQRRAKVSKT